jgi:hypothetical protein
MIVRILGEGQLEVPESAVAELNQLDGTLESAVERSDEAAFRPALSALVARVRELGTAAPPDDLRPSELIIPGPEATMDEVRRMLTDEGLIPG